MAAKRIQRADGPSHAQESNPSYESLAVVGGPGTQKVPGAAARLAMQNGTLRLGDRLMFDVEIKRRVDAFEESKAAHPLLTAALERLVRLVLHGNRSQVVLVYGPTGVGKSYLCQYLRGELVRRVLEELLEDPGRMPVGFTTLPNPQKGILDWATVWTLVLLSFDEIMVDEKISPRLLGVRRNSDGTIAIENKPKPDMLRLAVEQCMRNRRPLAMLYDEGQGFTKVGPGADKLLNQMDNLKSLAEDSKTPQVLFGTYDLLLLRSLSEQVARRAERVHLARYVISDHTHKKAFMSVIKKFEEQLKLYGDIDVQLGPLVKLLNTGSWGCVGILKDWLTKAMWHALYARCSSDPVERALSFADHVRATILPDEELIKIGTKIIEGEKLVQSMDDNKETLAHLERQAAKQPAVALPGTRRAAMENINKQAHDPAGQGQGAKPENVNEMVASSVDGAHVSAVTSAASRATHNLESRLREIQARQGSSPTAVPDPQSAGAQASTAKGDTGKPNKRRGRGRPRPGQRGPGRDPVGLGAAPNA